MTRVVTLRTQRLLLRPWRESDRAPVRGAERRPEGHGALPRRQHARGVRCGVRSDRRADGRCRLRVLGRRGAGVVEFVGFTGLGPADEVLGRPVLEIGWRLAAEHWGRGYATEGARASLGHAFDALAQKEVVSFTTAGNQRSRRVMERLGMIRRPEDDFDHPGVPPSWSGRRHVLYRMTAQQWRSRAAAETIATAPPR